MEAEERLKLRRQLNAQEKDYAKQRRQEIKEISYAIKKNDHLNNSRKMLFNCYNIKLC